MRVAAVALVLIVGAAVVLAFANTLNSWVLGGLLGGLAAILLSIPISLALFTLLARRHDARQRSAEEAFAEEPDFADERYGEPVVYEAEGHFLPAEEDFSPDFRARSLIARPPVSGYLPLPPAGQDLDPYDDDEAFARREPRNYPRLPRNPARSFARDDEIQSPPARSYRNPSTRSLAEHQSAARRQARQEAQQQHLGPDARSRRSQETHTPPALRPRSSGQVRPQGPVTGSRRPIDEYPSRRAGRGDPRSSWHEEEDFAGDLSTDQLRTRYQPRPSRRGYRLNPRASRAVDPWSGQLAEDDEQEEPRAQRPRRDPERLSGSLRNPLVRRAPYLYDDDPLREELAQQIENERPITRRSSLNERYEDEEDY